MLIQVENNIDEGGEKFQDGLIKETEGRPDEAKIFLLSFELRDGFDLFFLFGPDNILA